MRLSSKHHAFLEMSNEVTCRMSTLFDLFDYGLMIIWDAAMYEFETFLACLEQDIAGTKIRCTWIADRTKIDDSFAINQTIHWLMCVPDADNIGITFRYNFLKFLVASSWMNTFPIIASW